MDRGGSEETLIKGIHTCHMHRDCHRNGLWNLYIYIHTLTDNGNDGLSHIIRTDTFVSSFFPAQIGHVSIKALTCPSGILAYNSSTLALQTSRPL